MNVFYDFETSTRDPLGQILTYSFIVVDAAYNILSECNGSIKPSRIELPDPEAILVSKLNIDVLHKEGKTEYEAAKIISRFLGELIDTYQRITLIGFNSNQFDNQFLRNLLVRYGLNPYFFGKINNVDILHFVQHLAFKYPEQYPWKLQINDNGDAYYEFRLESVAKAFQCLHKEQSHNAREDVMLTISLVKALEQAFGESFSEFQPINEVGGLSKQKVRDFPKEGNIPRHYIHKYWLTLAQDGKQRLLVDLATYENLEKKDRESLLKSLKYINFNKHFWETEALNEGETRYWESIISEIAQDPFLRGLTLESYFQLTKKPWDIDYQIHELGFKNIDRLCVLVQEFIKNPKTYTATFETLWETTKIKKDPKDIYLVQLYNRVYLKHHPEPHPEHIKKYLIPRYVTGTMHRNKDDFIPIQKQIEKIDAYLASSEKSEEDKVLLRALKPYYLDVLTNFIGSETA
jgi:hypothetical protein